MSNTRAVAMVMLLAASHCAEWVPASVAQATGEAHVRVRDDVGRVAREELELPSRRTLMHLRSEGASFEVRRSNADRIVVPVVLAAFAAAVIGAGLFALAAEYKPCCGSGDWSALGGVLDLSSASGAQLSRFSRK